MLDEPSLKIKIFTKESRKLSQAKFQEQMDSGVIDLSTNEFDNSINATPGTSKHTTNENFVQATSTKSNEMAFETPITVAKETIVNVHHTTDTQATTNTNGTIPNSITMHTDNDSSNFASLQFKQMLAPEIIATPEEEKQNSNSTNALVTTESKTVEKTATKKNKKTAQNNSTSDSNTASIINPISTTESFGATKKTTKKSKAKSQEATNASGNDTDEPSAAAKAKLGRPVGSKNKSKKDDINTNSTTQACSSERNIVDPRAQLNTNYNDIDNQSQRQYMSKDIL